MAELIVEVTDARVGDADPLGARVCLAFPTASTP
jgi:hypothetical protein